MAGELAHGGQREELVRLVEARLQVAAIRGEGGVGVDVDETRHQDLSPGVELRPVERAECRCRPDGGDAAVLDRTIASRTGGPPRPSIREPTASASADPAMTVWPEALILPIIEQDN